MSKTQQTGQAAEDIACRYLQQQGLQLITRNYRCRMGEIDLIMQDRDMLVFVEVRYRKNDCCGGSLHSINNAKQIKLLRAASFYLQQNQLTEKAPCRFDVIAINSLQDKHAPEWLKNVFQPG
jgi:putative endonuclease